MFFGITYDNMKNAQSVFYQSINLILIIVSDSKSILKCLALVI